MRLASTVTSIVKLPLTVVGRLVGAVTGRFSSSDTATPPTDVAPVPESVADEPAPAAPAPAKPATAKPAAAKKAAPTKKAAPAASGIDLEPTPPPVTDIDASAADTEVDVTPADLASVMGTQLDESESITDPGTATEAGKDSTSA